jgi:broad specificity phosphatase PhoE
VARAGDCLGGTRGDENRTAQERRSALQHLVWQAWLREAEMSVQMQQVYLIRHGETEWSLSGQHTGITDIPLTENGRKVAKRLEPVLAKETFALVLTSPLQRARETCELAGLGERAQIDRDLMEWNYGEYEGLTSREIREKVPGWLLFNDGCPGGETPEQVGDRADRIIARARGAQGNVVLFAHGHLLRVLATRWLGFRASAGRHFLLDTGTLNILSYYQGAPAIKGWNWAVE